MALDMLQPYHAIRHLPFRHCSQRCCVSEAFQKILLTHSKERQRNVEESRIRSGSTRHLAF